MTSKDYIAIAGAIAPSYLSADSCGCHAVDDISDVIDRIADVLEADNPRFLRSVFLRRAKGEL